MSSACSGYTLVENSRDQEDVEAKFLETSKVKLM
jgi:hypothetical protein